MRHLIMFLLFLVASVWFGLDVMSHPGYLLFVYQPWMVQMPLWFAILSLFLCFIVFYLLISSIDRVYFFWFRMKSWMQFRRERRFYSKTQHGLAKLIEGRWKQAERLLMAGVHKSIEPLMNYLGAARAAHEMAAYDRRDQYLQKAQQVAPEAHIAIGLTQAELAFSQNHFEHAAVILNHLRQLSPRHPGVLKLLEKVYIHSADWESLQMLLPSLRKAKVLNSEQFSLFEKNVYCERLRTVNINNPDDFHRVWDAMPRHVRKNPAVVCAYIKRLLAKPNDEVLTEAAELIRKTLNNNWSKDLVLIYSHLPLANLKRQLVIVGAWLKMYGDKPSLLLLQAKLCVQLQLWGKAKTYFESCLAQGPNAEASFEFGKLLEQLGEASAALRQFQQGLKAEVHTII